MTIKEMFKKVEAYNEIAEIMGNSKAKITVTTDTYWGDTFSDYNSCRKYIRREYIKELADFILNSKDWEIDGEQTFKWVPFKEEVEVRIEVQITT